MPGPLALMRLTSIVAGLLLFAPSFAHAAADAPTAPAKPAKQGGSEFDFDLLGPPTRAPALDPAFEAKVHRRRTMLQWHQGLGIALLGSLAATEVFGQLDFNDRFRGGGDTGKWEVTHLSLVALSTTLFATVGTLGLLAPNPYPKHFELDTAFVHKALMTLATVGMLTQLILGCVAEGQSGSLSERDLVGIHQVVGYVTAGAVFGGALSYVF